MNLLHHHDIMIHIFSFLDTCTLLLSLDISSLFYSRITHDHVWKDRWIWRSNHHNISLTYPLYREIRNLEIELILDCCEFMKDSSRDQSYYDHKYEKMNIWILECLLSFCDHLECFHENHEHQDSLNQSFDFLSHLGVQFSLLENKKFYQFIQHYHTIIKFYVSQQRWESFFHRIQDPFLPSFYRNLSCILMEGLIQIAALQPFGCEYSRVQKFAHLIVERTWKKVGEHSGTLELLHTPSYFPSIGWSLTDNSRSISDLEFSSFLRKREIVANHDRLMVLNILLDVFRNEFQFQIVENSQNFLKENSFIDHVVMTRCAIPLIGHILFQYCAYCIGLTSMAIVGPISHVILGMNMNPFNTIYISDSEDTVYIDLRDDGKILTVSQLLQNFSFLAPGMNIEIYRGGLNVDRVIQNELLSSLNASTIFLPILNNLILVHKRATSPSLYHSRKFLVVILTYLNTQILILLSTLSLSTVTSPIPPPLIKPPRNIVWNIRNIAIFEKFFLVTKSLKFKTLFEHRMKDLQHIPDTPKVLLANIFED